jgi:MFS family permease
MVSRPAPPFYNTTFDLSVMAPGLLGKSLGFIRKQQSAFKVNMAKNVVQNFSLGLTQQYQSIYITALGATAMELGYVASAGGLAFALVTLPVGWLADRYGIRKVLLAALLLMACGYSVFGFATGWQVTAVAFMLTSVAFETTMNVCPMICGSSLVSAERVTGMQLCDTVASLPRLFAPVVAAYLITGFGGLTADGIRPLYWFEVTGLAVAFLIILRFFRDPRRSGGPERVSLGVGLRRVFGEGVKVRRWIVYTMLTMFPNYMALYVPLYARQVKGAGQLTLGLMDMGYWLIIVLLAIPVGLVADRFGRKRLIGLMAPLYSVGIMLLMVAPNEATLVVAGLLTGFIMLSSVTGGSISVELVPKELLGSWFGIIGLFRSLVSVASPLLAGLLWNSLGPASVLIFLAVTQVLKLGILATMPNAIPRD